MVNVPVVTAAGLKRDVGHEDTVHVEHLQIAVAHEVLREGGIEVSLAEQGVCRVSVLVGVGLAHQGEHGPGIGPAHVERDVGDDLHHLGKGDAVVLGVADVILE